MGTPEVIDVIDLTNDTSDVEEIPADQARRSATTKESKRQKKRKASVALEEGEIASSGVSRAPSPRRAAERGRVQLNEGARWEPSVGEGSKKRKKTKSAPSSSRASPQSRDKQSTSDIQNLDENSLFFVDTAPGQVAEDMAFHEPPPAPPTTAPSSSAAASPPSPTTPPPRALLLPAHVSIAAAFDGAAIEPIRLPSPDSDAESYIDYLDYDDHTTGVARYFDDRSEEKKKARIVCKKCGIEGEHTTKDCPVLICLTCGARDEHSTFSCPISKTCFNCGMKGHMSRQCPNRKTYGRELDDNCDRCGSTKHRTNECPSHWRIYEYVSESERQRILQARDAIQDTNLGDGGEAYIARDEWCYNCGGVGHLGDDCVEIAHAEHIPQDPSAFSSYNTMSGPFFDAEPRTAAPSRKPREWEADGVMMDGWGLTAPTKVGEKGRSKDRKRMAERARQANKDDDEEDWFNDPNRNIRIRGAASASSAASNTRREPLRAPQGIKLASPRINDWRSKQAPQVHKPLWARLSEEALTSDSRRDRHDRDRGSRGSYGRDDAGRSRNQDHLGSSRRWEHDRGDNRPEKGSEREWDRGKARPDRDHREWNRDSNGSRRDDRQRPGPRYRGGYGH